MSKTEIAKEKMSKIKYRKVKYFEGESGRELWPKTEDVKTE
jgi:hypothetical protein